MHTVLYIDIYSDTYMYMYMVIHLIMMICIVDVPVGTKAPTFTQLIGYNGIRVRVRV